ncbi:MAG: right-handed parallel beta-helix repeat-containing protein [Verrucomicrobiaceae bacterium]|nr:right-handed parallel beta-helix repeat-containing protein [Verrucomicrobiaceae bacterium]
MTFFAPCPAADYYVAKSGNDDGPGSALFPWENIQDGLDKLKPGDTLHVKPGFYREKLYFNHSGKPENPITLQGEPGAIISGKDLDDENIIYIEDQSHIRVIGLELRDNLDCNDGSAIRVAGFGTDIEIRNNKIHEIRGKDAMGITIYGTNARKPVSKLVIDGNEIFNCDPAESEALTLNGNIQDFVVSNNYVHDCNNIGIDFIGGEDWVTKHPEAVARDGVCKHNRVTNCRSTYGGGYAAGIYVDCGKNIVIEDNIVTGCDLGLEIGAENKGFIASGIIVRRNIIFHNDKAGIVFGGYEAGRGRVQDCKFTANLCYQNALHKKERNGELWIQHASNNEVTDNTFVGKDGSLIINVDAGGSKGNKVNANRYFTSAGAETAAFHFAGDDIVGFDDWKKASGWDLDTKFGPVNFIPPSFEPK